jgi:hypothetical protein
MQLKIVRLGGEEKSSAVTGNSSVPLIKAESKTCSWPSIIAAVATPRCLFLIR